MASTQRPPWLHAPEKRDHGNPWARQGGTGKGAGPDAGGFCSRSAWKHRGEHARPTSPPRNSF